MSGIEDPFFRLTLSSPLQTPGKSSGPPFPRVVTLVDGGNPYYGVKTVTPTIPEYKCPQCPAGKKAFKTEQALRSHQNSGVHSRWKGNGNGKGKGRANNQPLPAEINPQPSNEKPKPPARVRALPNTPYRLGPEPVSRYSSERESVRAVSQAIAGTQRLTLDQIIGHIDTELDETQVLIITIGSETVQYVGEILTELGLSMGFTCSYCAEDFTEAAKGASCGAQIISGSVNIVKNLIAYRRLRTEHLKLLVLNKEATLLDSMYHDFVFAIHRYLRLDTKIARAYIGVWMGTPGRYRLSLQSMGLPDPGGRDQKEVEKQERIDEISISMVKRCLGYQ